MKPAHEASMFLRASETIGIRIPARPVPSTFNADRALASDDQEALVAFLREAYADEHFRVAVAHAAPSLWSFVSALLDGRSSPKFGKVRRAAMATAKFSNRMSTRPTPFGLFAGVGEISCAAGTPQTPPVVEDPDVVARPDLRWLLPYVRGLELRPDLVTRHRLFLNDLAWISTREVVLHQPKDIRGHQRRISLKRTSQLDALLRGMGRGGAPAGEVIERIVSEAGASVEAARSLVLRLLDWGILYSGLRPRLRGGDPLRSVIEEARRTGVPHRDLLVVEEKLRALPGALSAGEGAFSSLRDAARRMTELQGSSDPIHLMSLNRIDARLPESMLREAETTADLLQRLSLPRLGVRGIRAYHLSFLERYGIERTVPIKTLVDPHRGIGVPHDYLWPERGWGSPPDEEDGDSPRRERHRARLLWDALREGAGEVRLTDRDVEALAFPRHTGGELQDSAELYFTVSATSYDRLHEGDYALALGPNPGSHVAVSTPGRFLDHLPETRRHLVAPVVDDETEYSAVLVYAPRTDSAANIASAPSCGHRAITVNVPYEENDRSVRLEDIGVGASMTGLFAVDLRDGRRIRLLAHHSLYPAAQAPNEVRLLTELMHEGRRLWEPWSWGRLEHMPFTPAVRYGRVTVAPAVWDLGELRDAVSAGAPVSSDAFDRWARRRRVPRYCLAISRDMRLLVDLGNEGHRSLLLRELRRDAGLNLQELPGGAQTSEEAWGWLRRDGNFFAHEIVVTLRRSDRGAASDAAERQPAATSALSEVREADGPRHLPGGPWTSARLYMAPDEMRLVLRRHVAPLFRELLAQRDGCSPFYLRYEDAAGPHLRLRVHHGTDEDLRRTFLRCLRRLCEDGRARTFVVDEYVPEAHRYGGEALLPYLHRVFSEDALSTLEELESPASSLFAQREDYVVGAWFELLAVLGAASHQEGTNDPLETVHSWLVRLGIARSTDGRYARSRDRWKAVLLERAHHLRERGEDVVRPAASRFGREVKAALEGGTVTSSPERIFGSLLHMTFNRISGPDAKEEQQLLGILRSVVEDLVRARRMRERAGRG